MLSDLELCYIMVFQLIVILLMQHTSCDRLWRNTGRFPLLIESIANIESDFTLFGYITFWYRSANQMLERKFFNPFFNS